MALGRSDLTKRPTGAHTLATTAHDARPVKMPKMKPQPDCKPYSLVNKRRVLQSVAAQMEAEAAEAERQAAAARQKEQVCVLPTPTCTHPEPARC